MEFEIGYAYILPVMKIDNMEMIYHNILSASELCLANEIKFSLHLGNHDSYRSVDWWFGLMRYVETIPLTHMIINLQQTSGDPLGGLHWFEYNYNRLPQYVKTVLKLENDASVFSVSDVVNIYEKTGIPIIINLYNDKNFSSAPLEQSIDRIGKLEKASSIDFIINDLEESFNELKQILRHQSKKINVVVASNEYNDAINKIMDYKNHERLKAEFINMVDSKLRKSEKDVWFNPDHDHLDKHLK